MQNDISFTSRLVIPVSSQVISLKNQTNTFLRGLTLAGKALEKSPKQDVLVVGFRNLPTERFPNDMNLINTIRNKAYNEMLFLKYTDENGIISDQQIHVSIAMIPQKTATQVKSFILKCMEAFRENRPELKKPQLPKADAELLRDFVKKHAYNDIA